MDKIEDVTGPVVGKKYLVRCAVSDRDICGYKQGEWAPIQGDVHSDAELGFPGNHLHYDWRFVPSYKLPEVLIPALAIMTERGVEIPVDLESIQYRSLTLRRLEFRKSAPTRMHEALDNIGRSLSPCTHICPHRGFPLNGVPTRDGLKVCPGHFLRFKADTGEYAPYGDAAT
jgi:hypothetical protein